MGSIRQEIDEMNDQRSSRTSYSNDYSDSIQLGSFRQDIEVIDMSSQINNSVVESNSIKMNSYGGHDKENISSEKQSKSVTNSIGMVDNEKRGVD